MHFYPLSVGYCSITEHVSLWGWQLVCVFQILAINFQCRGHVSRSYYFQVCSFRVNLCVYTILMWVVILMFCSFCLCFWFLYILNIHCDFEFLKFVFMFFYIWCVCPFRCPYRLIVFYIIMYWSGLLIYNNKKIKWLIKSEYWI